VSSAEPWDPVDPTDALGWPPAKGEPGEKTLYEAKLEARKKRLDAAIARAAAEKDADLVLEKAYVDAVLAAASASTARIRAAGETVEKAAAAIVTLYTAILALAFSVTENPLPFRAMFPAVLLGLALVLSVAFVAYIPKKPSESRPEGTPLTPPDLADDFVGWSERAALKRAYWLRASVLALGFSLFFLPAPFVGEIGVPDRVDLPYFGEVDIPWIEADETARTDPSGQPADPSAQPATASADEPPWPTDADVDQVTPVRLKAILFAAQVEEAKKKRTPPAQEEDDTFWWVAFVFAVVTVFVAPAFRKPRFGRRRAAAGSR
jgi:hypothetical protein